MPAMQSLFFISVLRKNTHYSGMRIVKHMYFLDQIYHKIIQ